MEKEEKRKEINKRHNDKRKHIGVSLYENDRALMIKKYGKVLGGGEIKKIILNGEVIIKVKQDNTDINILIVQLRKIGNNINQLAHISNANNNHLLENKLMLELNELKQTILDIKNKI